ncbi:MAG TPA: glutamate-5-semialdehyde dehydrogenase [Prevotella sp.]|nr:glutamate-5-semialdehyde dehydrogenase [uncultured Prevotella sp.]HRM55759.1 glutamate-5-semialdehyde dehydrogenase [Prevotella sp.]
MELRETFQKVKTASKTLSLLSDEQRNDILQAVADAIIAETPALLKANAEDLAKMDKTNPLYDRLQLTEQRLHDIAADMRHVSTLPSPLGRILKEKTLDNGLHLQRVAVPFGVIGMIYEARPNVTFDVFSLCFKSGNACVLKGGKDANCSNTASIELIHRVLIKYGIDPAVATLLPATHEATGEMLNAVGYIDLCIPRGGKKLIQFVRDTAKVPVIETGAGVVHCYFDKDGDVEMGKAIITNAKCRRCSVCNTLDTLIIHEQRLNDLPTLCEDLAKREVKIHADAQAYEALKGNYPDTLLDIVSDETPCPNADGNVWNTEWLSMQMGIKTVTSEDEALEHIATYGSGHSESIVSDNEAAQKKFQMMVDAACVYVNTPTSFTDGAQFGLGAEIGISTQKLGARGPMALEEITTYKWLITGNGQIRA